MQFRKLLNLIREHLSLARTLYLIEDKVASSLLMERENY